MRLEMSDWQIQEAEKHKAKHGVYPDWFVPPKTTKSGKVQTVRVRAAIEPEERTDKYEVMLMQELMQFRYEGLPLPECQYRWHETRQFRADFAYPGMKVLVEVQGGIYANKSGESGRHTTGIGYEADRARSNLAQRCGWMILEYGPKAIASGEAAKEIREVLIERGNYKK